MELLYTEQNKAKFTNNSGGTVRGRNIDMIWNFQMAYHRKNFERDLFSLESSYPINVDWENSFRMLYVWFISTFHSYFTTNYKYVT